MLMPDRGQGCFLYPEVRDLLEALCLDKNLREWKKK